MLEQIKFRKRLFTEIEYISLIMDELEPGTNRWEMLNCIRNERLEILKDFRSNEKTALDPNKMIEVAVKGVITVGALAWEERNVWTSKVFRPFGL